MVQPDEKRAIPTYRDILKTVIGELEKVNRNDVPLDETTDITADLNVDSVAVMDLLLTLEERFDVSIPFNELDEIRTAGELAKLVHRVVSED